MNHGGRHPGDGWVAKPAGSWRDRAACKGRPVAEFFPTVRRGDQVPPLIASAVAVCARCPVAADCRAEAVRNDYVGVWGGTRFDDDGRVAFRLRKAGPG
ncbi:MAG TPA: WhiB family transcriptional regulator [Acidimicrobiales bacterium]|nr:WhiB family transcriptional regulator [Acidimicrobiales bacterium]